MRKIKLTEKLKEIRIRNIILLIIFALVTSLVLGYLETIHYKVSYLFYWGPNSISNFKKYENEFQLLVKETDRFIEDHPKFFEEFNGECSVQDDGLVFFKVDLPYPDNKVFYKTSSKDWSKVKNFRLLFPPAEFYYQDIFLDYKYPNYIFFRSDETSSRVLVYTRDGKPKDLIDDYWEKFNFVRVKKVAHGWYDIIPIERK